MALRVIDLGSVSGIEWLATPYAICDRLTPHADPAVVFAEPLEPCLSVGANQNIHRDIDRPFCRRQGIPIVRRHIGGSALYIDRDQLVFHVVTPKRRAPRPASQLLVRLGAGLADTLRDFGIASELRRPADIVVGRRKIAGIAGAAIGDNVVVGGTLLFDFDTATMTRCLRFPSEELRAKVADLGDRGTTTMRRELGTPPTRDIVKAHLVTHLTRWLVTEHLEHTAASD